jgi:hypothetical protein
MQTADIAAAAADLDLLANELAAIWLAALYGSTASPG